MAGTEFSGFENSHANMFCNASMIIVPPEGDESIISLAKKMLAPAEFGNITVTTAEHHDEMIAYTSQMCHVISNSYVKSPRAQQHAGFSAGSFADLTRVAKLNPTMWTELFIENKDNLINEIELLCKHLNEYKEALVEGDSKRVCELLKDGVRCKESAEKLSSGEVR